MQFFQWIVAYWQPLCGWAMGFYVIYLFGRTLASATITIRSIVERWRNAEDSLVRVESVVGVVAGNHLPHIQAELEKSNLALDKSNETLLRLREDIRLFIGQKIREHEEE